MNDETFLQMPVAFSRLVVHNVAMKNNWGEEECSGLFESLVVISVHQTVQRLC